MNVNENCGSTHIESLQALVREKGLDPASVKALDIAAYKQQQYDILADGLRRSLNMDAVYKIVEEGL